MTDKEKLDAFKEYLERIETWIIRDFTEFVILKLPEYFWILPASTSNKNHGKGESLLDHIFGCLYLAKDVAECQFRNHWTRKQKDQLYASLILHDGWRCGEPNNECRFVEADIDKYNLDPSLLGNLRTAKNHAEVGYRQLLQLVIEYNRLAARNKKKQIGAKDYSMILKAVRFHYGPWTNGSDKLFSLSWPFDSVAVQCHNIDFMQSTMQRFLTRNGVEHTED